MAYATTCVVANHIANTFLTLAFSEGADVAYKDLQALLSLFYEEYYEVRRKLPFTEPVLALPAGPCVESIRSKFECFGRAPIKRFGRDASGNVYSLSPTTRGHEDVHVYRVWGVFRCLGAQETRRLVTMGSDVESPWALARKAERRTIEEQDLINNDYMRRVCAL